MQDVFQQIYDNNGWKNNESVSGNGSTKAATAELRRVMPDILDKYEIDSIVDVACGDLNWFGDVVLGRRRYLGIDIVPALIEKNRVQYGGLEHVYFSVSDITRDPLPKADLIFARDVLVHFSNSEVKRALNIIRASGSAYLMATTFPRHENSGDMVTGNWRPLNLEQFWGLGTPLEIINEHCTVPGFEDKSMGIWRLP